MRRDQVWRPREAELRLFVDEVGNNEPIAVNTKNLKMVNTGSTAADTPTPLRRTKANTTKPASLAGIDFRTEYAARK